MLGTSASRALTITSPVVLQRPPMEMEAFQSLSGFMGSCILLSPMLSDIKFNFQGSVPIRRRISVQRRRPDSSFRR